MKKQGSLFRGGFTLVEMLIVVAVLGVLISLLAPAILKNIKVAGARGRENERAVLEAAIFEYWHDKNRWPIEAGKKPTKATGYKLTYRDDNYVVFNQLIDVDFGGQKKTYIDIGRHITTVDKETVYPAFSAAVVSLKDAMGGNRSIDRPLVYWGEFITHPGCPGSGAAAYSPVKAEKCQNCGYKFEPIDRKSATRGIRPFAVVIDMLNNTVSVKE